MAVNRVVFKDPVFRRRNEGELFDVDLTFLDGDIPTDPTYYYWRIDDVTAGKQLVAWTAESTAAATDTLSVPAIAQEMTSSFRGEERRQLVVAGPNQSIIGRMEWMIEQLTGVGGSNVFPAPPV